VSKKSPVAKAKKRQSVSNRLPLSRFNINVALLKRRLVSALQWDVAETVAKPAKQAPRAVAKPIKAKAASRKQRQISLPITRSTKILITVKHTKKPAKHKTNRSKRPISTPSRSLAGLNRQIVTAAALVLIGLTGSVYFGWHAVMAAPAPPPPSTSLSTEQNVLKDVLAPASKTAKHYPKSQPLSISIPDIDVGTTISTVGNNSDGSMVVPADWHTAGWYQYSPTPGEVGPAVIDGHLDNVSGLAVFWRLRELTPGEFIYVTRADGTTVQFRVDSMADYSQADFPTKKVYGNINYAGLRLITCGGTFNRLTHHYDQNTVVYATLAN
jgi:sortase (surface protein transpeptidase)